MKIYISGSISASNDYEIKFKEKEKLLKQLSHIVLNPVKNVGFTYREYIDMALAELSKCECIYMLKGWEHSKGAQLEKMYAETVGLIIMFEE